MTCAIQEIGCAQTGNASTDNAHLGHRIFDQAGRLGPIIRLLPERLCATRLTHAVPFLTKKASFL
jgi:hypothetical protein